MFLVIRFRRRSLRIIGASTVMIAALTFFALHPNLETWRKEGVVLSRVDTRERVMALTFDDGPDPRATPEVLKVLEANGVRATFFVLGSQARKYPGLVKAISDHGHEVGNHGYSHLIKNYINIEYARRDIEAGARLIQEITGTSPRLLRPPGGFLSYDLVDYCKENNILIVTWTWDTDVKDWKAVNPDQLAGDLVSHAGPGKIVILHDGGQNRDVLVEALARAIPVLLNKGYRLVTVSELRQYQE